MVRMPAAATCACHAIAAKNITSITQPSAATAKDAEREEELEEMGQDLQEAGGWRRERLGMRFGGDRSKEHWGYRRGESNMKFNATFAA
ncbi:hypothetical protein KR018_006567 [Drosophila ironensis]|nr:hypothetical protein KR018_006567 [Drosophila ironensis]